MNTHSQSDQKFVDQKLVVIIQNMKKEIDILKDSIADDANDDANYQARKTPSSGSFIRRVCKVCRQNHQLGRFSKIELKQTPGKSICCRCI